MIPVVERRLTSSRKDGELNVIIQISDAQGMGDLKDLLNLKIKKVDLYRSFLLIVSEKKVQKKPVK